MYDPAMTVSVDKTRRLVTGIYSDSLGDPANGGATCWFYFIADFTKMSGTKVPVSIYNVGDGADANDMGEILEILSPTKFTLTFKPDALPNGAARFGYEAGGRVSFSQSDAATDKLWAGHAMRRVAAKKATCFDEDGSAQRPFVVAHDAFVVVNERKDWVEGVYSRPASDAETACWFKTTDLMPLPR